VGDKYATTYIYFHVSHLFCLCIFVSFVAFCGVMSDSILAVGCPVFTPFVCVCVCYWYCSFCCVFHCLLLRSFCIDTVFLLGFLFTIFFGIVICVVRVCVTHYSREPRQVFAPTLVIPFSCSCLVLTTPVLLVRFLLP